MEEYATITILKNGGYTHLNLKFNRIFIDNKEKSEKLVNTYKTYVSENNKIKITIDCSLLRGVNRGIAFGFVRQVRDFEKRNAGRIVHKRVIVPNPAIRAVVKFFSVFLPPVVPTKIVSRVN
jgi:hypothetical protein